MSEQISALPGPLCRDLKKRRDAVVARGVANGAPIFAARASGCEVEDVDGHRFIDFAGGIGTLNVGHAHPEVVQAIKQQADRFLHTCFNIVMYPEYIELCERLVDIVPGDWPKKVMLQSTGSEAVENAIKIARKATGRPAIVAFEHAFLGRTLMALSLTAKGPAYKAGFGPFAPEVYRVPFPQTYRSAFDNEADCVEAAFAAFKHTVDTEVTPGQVAAVIIEPVQGEGGFNVVPQGFFSRLREYCTQHGIVLIADEIQSGFCRTGKWFATEHYGVQADIYTLAKSMGGGMPIAAVVGRADLIDAPIVGGLGGTYGGNPLACAAALATINVMQRDDYAGRGARIGEQVRKRFLQWQSRYDIIGDVRGLGAMVAMDIVSDRQSKTADGAITARIVDAAYRRGLLLVKAGYSGNIIRFLGPLSADASEIDRGLDILGDAIAEVIAQSEPVAA
ncbi:MAG: 4-aminobutyrate--2-oxoglutarate transaminase [Comamonadaceae bacterium]|nr:MAG: 4-aminobutyrate--2-oxoglutarate transaminase [Comamonadaceae bacterium]